MVEITLGIITFLLNSFLGLFVFYRNTRSWTNRFFLILTFLINIYLVTNYLSLHPPLPTADNQLFWIRVVMFVCSFIGPALFLLIHTFPGDKITLSRTKLISLLLLCTISATASLLPFVFTSIEYPAGQPVPKPGPAIPIFFIDFVGLFLISILLLILKYKRAKGIEKTQHLYFLLGIVSTFSVMGISTVVFVVILKFSGAVFLGPISTLSLIAFVAYAIVKHRFLDVRLVVARAVSYALLITLFGLLYSLFFATISSLFITASIESKTITVSTILALIMAFSFQSVRRGLEKITDSFLYKDKYNTDKLLYDLTLIMASSLQLEELTHQLLKNLLQQMRINRAAFILTDGGKIYEVAHEGYKETPEFNEDDIVQLENKNQTLIFEELSEDSTKKIMRNLDFSIVLNLHTAGQQIGILTLGEKMSGDIYTNEDIKVLEIFVPEATVAIKNALSYEEIRRFNITLKDEVKQATTKLTRANIHLKELDHLKDEFVSLASHELRTPMTAIKSYLWLALNKSTKPLPDDTKKNLEVSYRETERLIKLVQNMLTISRIEGKRLELNIEPIDIYELTKQLYDELKIKAVERKIKFTLATSPEKLIVHADKEKIAEVMQNLIGNALKYTPEKGSVSISFSLKPGKVGIYVSDTGSGISSENLTKLFQKFGRLEDAKKSRTQGTGLGLYISKQIVDLHKGQIKVESEVDKGTTFIVELPLAQ